MPLEIRELHIRVTVNQPQPEGNSPAPAAATGDTKTDSQALVQQCVEQVLDIMNSKNER